MQIVSMTIDELLENDANNEYRCALSRLSNKYSRFREYRTASKVSVDNDVLVATETIIQAALQADNLLKQADFDREAGLITKVIIKTLQVAQKVLAGLLITSPVKVGIAYNAMHNVIKFLEKEMRKKVL